MTGDMETILNYFGWVGLAGLAGFIVGVIARKLGER